MKKQEQTSLKDFFNDHIHFMALELNPSTNEFDMKPMEGAKEAFIKHFTGEEKKLSEDN